jgi:cytochrome d ubiquinol oxidase subunit II
MVPLVFVLWGILTRAVALEFRHLASPRSRRFTDWAFGLSSLTVTFFGGMCVGALLEGFPLTSDPNGLPTYVGGALRFVSPFSVWTGVAAVSAVSLSGGLFVRARFEPGEPVRKHAAAWTRAVFFFAVAAVPVTTLWIAVAFPWAGRVWFGPYFWAWWLIPVAAIGTSFLMRDAWMRERDLAALLWLDLTIVIMAGTFFFTVAGLFPVMLMYNWYQIWVFRARIAKLASYHA